MAIYLFRPAALIAAIVLSMPAAALAASNGETPECRHSTSAAGAGQDCAASLARQVNDPAPTAPAGKPPTLGTITRADRFAYRVYRPESPSGATIILLHGSGGDETSMFKLAKRFAPHATLLGIRGRVVQKGVKRWYVRLSPTEFDQDDIRNEAQAFTDFLRKTMAAERLDLGSSTFIGYSNGANLLAALTLLHPDLIHRAVLLRAMPVLQTAPAASLRRSRFLTVAGKNDKIYGPFAPALETLLRERGATVDARVVGTGHFLGDEDVKVVSDWLAASDTMAEGTSQ